MSKPQQEAKPQHDPYLNKVLDNVGYALREKNDDFLVICCGATGSGKSNLMLHAMDYFLNKKADVRFLGLNRKDFANALNNAKNTDHPKFCGYDEANVSKRDALTKWNKDLIDLYWSIRGLRIFHWWCNPSIDVIDKPFIEERVKGVIYVATKDINRPRIYYYFRKEDLLSIWRKYQNLKLDLLKRICKKYCYYKGWFKAYNGELLAAYEAKKESRMDEKVEAFTQKYGVAEGQGLLTAGQMAKKMCIAANTVRNHIKQMKAADEIFDWEVSENVKGAPIYDPIIMDRISARLKRSRKNRLIYLNEGNHEKRPIPA